MPIYTYLCNKCGKQFDVFVRMNSDKSKVVCSECNCINLTRIFAPFSVRSTGMNSSCSGCSGGSCATCGK